MSLEERNKELERERDEARDIAEKLSKQGLEMMDENRSLKRERRSLKRERDEARDDFEEEKKWHNRTHSELVDTQCKLQDTNIELDRLQRENEALKE